LIYLDLETHLHIDKIETCNEEFSILTPHICKYKEEKKLTDEVIIEDLRESEIKYITFSSFVKLVHSRNL